MEAAFFGSTQKRAAKLYAWTSNLKHSPGDSIWNWVLLVVRCDLIDSTRVINISRSCAIAFKVIWCAFHKWFLAFSYSSKISLKIHENLPINLADHLQQTWKTWKSLVVDEYNQVHRKTFNESSRWTITVLYECFQMAVVAVACEKNLLCKANMA